jgi:hypothetical protein
MTYVEADLQVRLQANLKVRLYKGEWNGQGNVRVGA